MSAEYDVIDQCLPGDRDEDTGTTGTGMMCVYVYVPTVGANLVTRNDTKKNEDTVGTTRTGLMCVSISVLWLMTLHQQ